MRGENCSARQGRRLPGRPVRMAVSRCGGLKNGTGIRTPDLHTVAQDRRDLGENVVFCTGERTCFGSGCCAADRANTRGEVPELRSVDPEPFGKRVAFNVC